MNELSPTSPILFVGDTHRDIRFWRSHIYDVIERFEVELVFQLGDFGYAPHKGDGRKYLDLLSAELTVPLYWLDGNHDDHDTLALLPREDGLATCHDGITHVARGTRLDLGETQFLVCGGAYSIDKAGRVEQMEKRRRYAPVGPDGKRVLNKRHISWWPGEMVTEEDVQKCVQGGNADVVLAHDTPASIDLNKHFAIGGGYFFKGDTNSLVNRYRLETVLRVCQPKYWLNGHFHLPYVERVPFRQGGYCVVRGLDCNTPTHTGWTPQSAWWIGTPESMK